MRWLLGCGLIVLGVVACSQPDDSELFAGQATPSNGQSCVDSCGGPSPDGTCSCTVECAANGDCCSDVDTACSLPVFDAGLAPPTGGSGGTSAGGTGGMNVGGTSAGGSGAVGGSATGGAAGGVNPSNLSCTNLCGGPAADESCWCDDQCQAYGDCCPDYTQVCPAPPPPVEGGCNANLCNSANPALENGNPCYCDSVCSQYGDCCSNYASICQP
jgi:hypothetical protein